MDLDSCVLKHKFPQPDWIKLDVQGSELDILAGGSKCFSFAQFVLCEVPLVPYNLGAPNLSEVLNIFLKEGFLPSCLVEIHHHAKPSGPKSSICQLDIFFERS
jgi:hypothetical protein